MKRVVCANALTLAHKSLDELQRRIDNLQRVKDKLEAKLNESNKERVQEAIDFFSEELDECIQKYAKTVYDSTL